MHTPIKVGIKRIANINQKIGSNITPIIDVTIAIIIRHLQSIRYIYFTN